MADLQQLIQESRKLVPYTDEEICEIYHRATEVERAEEVEVAKEAAATQDPEDSVVPFSVVFADAVLNCAFLAFVTELVTKGESVTAVLFIGSAAMFITLMSGLCGYPYGLFSHAATEKKTAPKLMRKIRRQRVNVEDPEVLATVMRFMSREPLLKSEELVEEIAYQRQMITSSLEDLKEAARALDQEIATSESDDIKLLLTGQRAAADEYIRQLSETDQALADQQNQALEAVRPVNDILNRIARIGRINETFERVRAAHQMVEYGQESLTMNKLELNVLVQASRAAMARLADLEGLVKATQAARGELEASMRRP